MLPFLVFWATFARQLVTWGFEKIAQSGRAVWKLVFRCNDAARLAVVTQKDASDLKTQNNVVVVVEQKSKNEDGTAKRATFASKILNRNEERERDEKRMEE